MKRQSFIPIAVVLGLGLLLGILAVGSPPSPAALAAPAAATRYVQSGATGNCGSWVTACELQDALDVAESGDEIWVATGVYTPTAESTPGFSRTATFQLVSGVAIYGGFAGTESSLDDRDWKTHVTVLSGDFLGDDGAGFTNYGDNSYHVVTGSGTNASAVLDGFTISGGNADDTTWPHFEGGGMRNDGGSPTLTNVTFSGNQASVSGGGMHNFDGSNPELTDIIFSDNTTSCSASGCSAKGGGMYNDMSSPTLLDVTFSGNTASCGASSCSAKGGGMYNTSGSNPELTDVTFSGNTTSCSGSGCSAAGGGMLIDLGAPILTNCAFSGSTASYGGAMWIGSADPTLINCTFSGNTATYGGAIYNNYGNPSLINCILWDNTATNGPQISNGSVMSPTISYSDIEGAYHSGPWDASLGTDGGNNIDVDPLFQDADGPDNIAGTADDNLRLDRGSAAIDSGHNGSVPFGITTDLDGNPRFFTDLDLDGDPDMPAGPVDMGAYEAQYGWYMTYGDERLSTGRAYRTLFHNPQSMADALASYDVDPLHKALDAYALAPDQPDIPPGIPTAEWLVPRLDACWEIATGEMLVGNQDFVEALDPRLTGAYPTLPTQITELGAAKDHFVQAADPYLDLLAGELYAPAMTLQPGRVGPLSGEAEPYADVQRLAQALAKKSGAHLALAERYFRQYTPGSRNQAQVKLNEGWELAVTDLALLDLLVLDWPAAGENQAYQVAYQALTQNIADMQRIDSYLDPREAKNPFGYDTDYVPFHPVQGTSEPDPNFEYWWGEARWDDPDRDDYVGWQRANQEIQALLNSQRDLDEDKQALIAALDALDIEYQDRLGELCGYKGGSADYEGCHGGEMGLQVDEIRAAKLRIERTFQQMENQAELIRIEQQRAASVAGIQIDVAVMYDEKGQELADLARKEAELRFTKSEMGMILDQVGGALMAFDEGGTNFGVAGGIATAGVGMIINTLKTYDQNKTGYALADVAEQKAEIEAYQKGYVKYADARIENANSEALVKEYLLEYALLDLDLALAFNELEQEIARLEGLKTEVEYLLARWAEAGRDASDLYLDPAERVFRDQQAERAGKYFDLALETAYKAARALDYEMAQTWTEEDQGYGLVGTDNLLTHLDDMNAEYQSWNSISGNSWCDTIKLSEAMGYDQETFKRYVRDADNWVDLDDNGTKESLRLTFETSLLEPYRFFSRNVYNDKIQYYNIVLMGDEDRLDKTGNGTRVALRQSGTSTVRDSTSKPFGEDSFKEYNLEPTPPHQVAALYNSGPTVCNSAQPYAGYGFYWRSVYGTDWTLTIDTTASEPVNKGDIDFAALEEIEFHVQHRDYPLEQTRLMAAPTVQPGAITTAAKLSHLDSDPDAAYRFAGTLYVEQPERLPPQQLALLLTETDGAVTGAIESEALLGYPYDTETGLGPSLSGTVKNGNFLLTSEIYTFISEDMTHQLFLTTTSATNMTINGEYVERIGGMTLTPLAIRGTFTLTRSFLGPQAAFSASPAFGPEPLKVTFFDWSQGEPTTWAWDFGDGTTWEEQNPTLPYKLTHTYDLPGIYTVSLTVSSAFGSDTHTETDCVLVGRFKVHLPLVLRNWP